MNIRQYYDEETRDERASPAKRAGSLHTKQTKPKEPSHEGTYHVNRRNDRHETFKELSHQCGVLLVFTKQSLFQQASGN